MTTTSTEERLQLHFLYWIVILGLALIFVMSDRWTDKGNFTEYLANAATMVSLVLALVAIFYSFIANDGLSKSLGNITLVSENIAQSKSQLGQFIEQSEELSKVGMENAATLKEISSSVEAHVKSLRATLEDVSSKTEALHGAMSGLPDRFDQMESAIEATKEMLSKQPEAPVATGNESTNLSHAHVSRFLNRSSIVGNILAYACVLACSNKKELSCDQLSKELQLSTPTYIHGYLISMIAIGLVGKKSIEGNSRTYIITQVNESLRSLTKDYLDKYIRDRYKDDEALLKAYQGKLQKLEVLLGASTA